MLLDLLLCMIAVAFAAAPITDTRGNSRLEERHVFAGTGPHSAPAEWLQWLVKQKRVAPQFEKYFHYLEVYERHFARFRGKAV